MGISGQRIRPEVILEELAIIGLRISFMPIMQIADGFFIFGILMNIVISSVAIGVIL